MPLGEDLAAPLRDAEVDRRTALKAFVGGGAVLGAGKAIDNVLIGYGTLTGTNLLAQAADGTLATIMDAGLAARGYAVTVGEYTVRTRPRDQRVILTGPTGRESFAFTSDGAAAARDADAAAGLDGLLEELVSDFAIIAAGEHVFEFYKVSEFFDRLDGATTRPHTVGALRGWPPADPDAVAAFTDTAPTDPAATLTGLITGFREHTSYDIPRYLAGSIEDNVIFGAADLRSGFQQPVSFEAILAADSPGLFCYEFTHRSIEALHSVPAFQQTPPMVGARVWDQRHKHVYTAVASALRDDGLRIPVAFVDYTHTTLYDDLGLRGVLGEGFEAFNKRHRATVTHWRP